MRCPKCGYISFDQQETCAKCSRNLQDTKSELKGTGVRGGKPSFLKSIIEESEAESSRTENYEAGAEEGIMALEEFDVGEVSEPEEDIGMEFFPDEEEEQAGSPDLTDSEEEFRIDFDEIDFEEPAAAETDAGGDEVVVHEEEPARPEEPDLKLQLESDILEEEPDEAGLEYDLENIDMSDLVIEDEKDEEKGENS